MLTAEQHLVMDLLRTSLADAEPSIVPDELDVPAVAFAIRRNGILPTVYPSLNAFPDLQHALQTEYYASVSQSVRESEAFGPTSD